MKINLVGMALAAFFFSCGVSDSVIQERVARLKHFIGYDDLVFMTEWRRTCLDANLREMAQRDQIETLLTDEALLRSSIKDRLAQVPHSYADLPPEIDETSAQVDRLHPEQLLYISLLLYDLEHTLLMRAVGAAFQRLADAEFFEVGGTCVLEHGMIRFSPQRNAGVDNPFWFILKEITGGYYKFPDEALASNHLFLFHSHMQLEHSPRPCGPSWEIRQAQDGESTLEMDLGAVFGRVLEHGVTHHLVMTKMPGRKINIDYAGGVMTRDSVFVRSHVAPCDQLRALVLLDLGVYSY